MMFADLPMMYVGLSTNFHRFGFSRQLDAMLNCAMRRTSQRSYMDAKNIQKSWVNQWDM